MSPWAEDRLRGTLWSEAERCLFGSTLLAGFADPVNFEAMGDDGEMIIPGRGDLKLLDDRLVELHDLSALDADEVVVVFGGLGLVAAELVVEPVFFDKPFFLECVQGPIDRGQTDPGRFGFDKSMNLFGAEVSLGFGKGLENAQSLLGRMDS